MAARLVQRRNGRPTKAWVAGVLCALVALTALSSSASADARTDYLVRLLSTSDTFRVRAQAAISLGRTESSAEVVQALGRALEDAHPAVRTAAAASLERLADPAALPALRAARSDRDASARRAIRSAERTLERLADRQPRTTEPDTATPAGDARYYVGIGLPGTQQPSIDRGTLQRAQDFLKQQVASMDGVRVAPDGENNRAAERILREARLTGYYVDSSIVRIEETGAGTRAVVSVIVGTYPGRDMRAILQGAATVPGATGEAAVRAAIEGALRGAMRRLPQAMEASRR